MSVKKFKSKWFVVATEGATTDGRTIQANWIEEMAENYDPINTYGARVNLEHIKYYFYDKEFAHSKCYGDVTALKAEKRDDGKLQLLAQIEPTDELIELNRQKQKVYTSIEVNTNFADTGKAYLVGLAVTDSPASIGTEYLQFCSTAQQNPLLNRKENPENLFTASVETVFEFEVCEIEKSFSLLEKVKAIFSKKADESEQQFTDHQEAIELLSFKLQESLEKQTALSQQVSTQQTELKNLTEQITALNKLTAHFAQLPEKDYQQRPKATGDKADSGHFF